MNLPAVSRNQAAAFYVNVLRPAVEQLACPPEKQIEWLQRERFDADEFALDHENAFRAAWQALEWGGLRRRTYGAMAKIDALFEANVGAATREVDRRRDRRRRRLATNPGVGTTSTRLDAGKSPR